MKNILEELWYGNVCPESRRFGGNDEAKKLVGYIAKHHDELRATLTDAQAELLDKFDDCQAELADIIEREIFAYAFAASRSR